jgi:hypothetical protein
MRPNEAGRRKVSLRGVVTDTDIKPRTTGMWFWKKEFPGIMIQFDDAQYRLAREQGLVTVPIAEYGDDTLPAYVRIYLPTEEHRLYPLGTEVGVTFGISPRLDQFLTRTTPCEVTNLTIITSGTALENEVLVPQPRLNFV